LVATEGVISIPWSDAAAPALALTSHFFEFADNVGRVHAAWELQDGACYSVLLTTGGGLYRYRLHDRVRVVGFHHLCPLIEFIGRDGITCDLCGEKLEEPFVRDCLGRGAGELGQVWQFAMLAPSGIVGRLGYTLYLSSVTPVDAPVVARAVDTLLSENVHFAHARRIGQLDLLDVVPLAGGAEWAWSRFHGAMAARGQRLGDIKPTALDCRQEWDAVFARRENANPTRWVRT
jgi:hypothetical protein